MSKPKQPQGSPRHSKRVRLQVTPSNNTFPTGGSGEHATVCTQQQPPLRSGASDSDVILTSSSVISNTANPPNRHETNRNSPTTSPELSADDDDDLRGRGPCAIKQVTSSPLTSSNSAHQPRPLSGRPQPGDPLRSYDCIDTAAPTDTRCFVSPIYRVPSLSESASSVPQGSRSSASPQTLDPVTLSGVDAPATSDLALTTAERSHLRACYDVYTDTMYSPVSTQGSRAAALATLLERLDSCSREHEVRLRHLQSSLTLNAEELEAMTGGHGSRMPRPTTDRKKGSHLGRTASHPALEQRVLTFSEVQRFAAFLKFVKTDEDLQRCSLPSAPVNGTTHISGAANLRRRQHSQTNNHRPKSSCPVTVTSQSMPNRARRPQSARQFLNASRCCSSLPRSPKRQVGTPSRVQRKPRSLPPRRVSVAAKVKAAATQRGAPCPLHHNKKNLASPAAPLPVATVRTAPAAQRRPSAQAPQPPPSSSLDEVWRPYIVHAFVELGGREDGSSGVPLARLVKVLKQFRLSMDLCGHCDAAVMNEKTTLDFKAFYRILKSGIGWVTKASKQKRRQPSTASPPIRFSYDRSVDGSSLPPVWSTLDHSLSSTDDRTMPGRLCSVSSMSASSTSGCSARGVALEAEHPTITIGSAMTHICRSIRRRIQTQLQQELESTTEGSTPRDPSLPPPAPPPLLASAETTQMLESMDGELPPDHSTRTPNLGDSLLQRQIQETADSLQKSPLRQKRSLGSSVSRPTSVSPIVRKQRSLPMRPRPPSSPSPTVPQPNATARRPITMETLMTLSPYYSGPKTLPPRRSSRMSSLHKTPMASHPSERTVSPTIALRMPSRSTTVSGRLRLSGATPSSVGENNVPHNEGSSMRSRRPSENGFPWDSSTHVVRPENPVGGLGLHTRCPSTGSCPSTTNWRCPPSRTTRPSSALGLQKGEDPKVLPVNGVTLWTVENSLRELYTRKLELAAAFSHMVGPTHVDWENWKELQRTHEEFNTVVVDIAAHTQRLVKLQKDEYELVSKILENQKLQNSTATGDGAIASPSDGNLESAHSAVQRSLDPHSQTSADEMLQLHISCNSGSVRQHLSSPCLGDSNRAASQGDSATDTTSSIRPPSSLPMGLSAHHHRHQLGVRDNGSGSNLHHTHTPETLITPDGDGPSPLANALLDQLIRFEAYQRRRHMEGGDDNPSTPHPSEPPATLTEGDEEQVYVGSNTIEFPAEHPPNAIRRRSASDSKAQRSLGRRLESATHSSRNYPCTSIPNGSITNIIGIASILSGQNLIYTPEDISHLSPPLDCLLRSSDGVLSTNWYNVSPENRTMDSSDPFFARYTANSALYFQQPHTQMLPDDP